MEGKRGGEKGASQKNVQDNREKGKNKESETDEPPHGEKDSFRNITRVGGKTMDDVIMPEKDEAADREDKKKRCVCETLERSAREDGVQCWHRTDAHEDDADTLNEIAVDSFSDCLRFRCFPSETRCKNEAKNEEQEKDAKEHRKEPHGVDHTERRKHEQSIAHHV